MSDESLNPTPDEPKAEQAKLREVRQAQQRKGKARSAQGNKGAHTNPIVNDETYGSLREENRVVMRHQIALNLDSFRAAPEDFTPRPERTYPPLQIPAAPFLSVIIPTYNGQRFLATVLDALQRQTFQDFEVILADDASSDDTVTFVETHYPAVRLLVNRRNLGFVKTCNLAVVAARAPVIVLLNNDTEPEPTWLAELVKTLCANPQAAIVTSKLLLFDQRNKLHTTGDLMGADGIPRNRGVWEEDRGQYDQQTEVFSGSGGGSAYRKDLWQQLGGFDEAFWMYLEDVDFAFRAQLLGWRTVFAPQARVYHHLSATGGGVLASYYVGRNTIWTIVKNMPDRLFWRNLPAIIASQLKVTLDALRNFRGEAARARLRGQWAGLLGLPAQLQKRQVIQARRQVADEQLAKRLS
ncbi:MAG: glycosyltransferase family 2 protein [Caldilineaceae bacterium]